MIFIFAHYLDAEFRLHDSAAAAAILAMLSSYYTFLTLALTAGQACVTSTTSATTLHAKRSFRLLAKHT